MTLFLGMMKRAFFKLALNSFCSMKQLWSYNYKSQRWGFASTLLAGFFCELDGDPTIHFDENELSEAIWLPRGEIPPATLDIALTSEMMELFRTGQN